MANKSPQVVNFEAVAITQQQILRQDEVEVPIVAADSGKPA